MGVSRQGPRVAELAERALTLFLLGSAAWALYGQAMVLGGVSFASLARFAPLVGLLVLGLGWAVVRLASVRLPIGTDGRSRPARIGAGVRLALAAAILLLYGWTGRYSAFWVGATLMLALAALDGPICARIGAPSEHDVERSAVWPVVGLAVLAVILTLVAHRPDPDDSFYLNLVVSSLDHPGAPLLAQDRMFGEDGLPLLAPVYRVQTYELAVAVLAWWTGAEPKTIYYLLLPALWAGLAVIASWLALRELTGRRSVLALVVVFVVLLTWGDGHAGYGNLSFVRLFQGKAVLLSVCVPSIVYAAARFLRRRDLGSWLLLAAAQIGAVGISANGVYVAPAVAAPLLLGGMRAQRSELRTVVLGLLSSVYVLALGAWLATQSETLNALVPEPRAAYGTAENLLRVIGKGLRGELALLALLALPAIPLARERAQLVIGYALAIVVIFLNPFISDLLARVARSMDWRIFWAIPLPLLLGLAVDGLARLGPMVGRVRAGAIAACVAAVLFVLAPARWTLSPANGLWLASPGHKVPPAYSVAEEAARATPPGGVILAPWQVAAWIATLHDHPRLIEVRPHYLRMVAYAHGPAEASRRRLLQRAVDVQPTRETWLPVGFFVGRHLPEVMQEIAARGVTTVVISKRVPWRRALSARLAAAGFEARDLGAYALWVRAGTVLIFSPRPKNKRAPGAN